MKKKLKPIVLLLVLCLMTASQQAMAYDPFGGVCSNGDASGSAVCATQKGTSSSSDPLTGPDGALAHITNIVAYIAGAAAIIIILVSALRFVTSGSDVSTGSRTDTDVEDARRSLVSALMGLAVIVLARTLILYIIDRL